uniref:RRM domain-containing protein n=1 Tax=Chromera velia CCMP2878 TaxID=1169474 RepID=A0A0G4IFN9_9ALVE|eukprot:Cvel_14077.t1-p1 / transcript=Cvel_14077.t1 / gene=Cvel_14077 / organism=Chromera_velia_CCMP2878 / gene_product=Sex-lethal homolog, putative / transcript_product=Sex-lethal homolog, putative / location=Cvel_scaffold988:46216-48292(-) / protein_length=489 / sequence_SO=supercontig / SO=protein_coding / is_pseudo=false
MSYELQGFPYCPNQWGQAGEVELPKSIPSGKFGLLGTNMFAFGLPQSWDRQKLFDHFKVCGKINRCRVIKGEKKMSRGYGFVSFVEHRSALRALQRLNGLVIGSGASRKRLRVTIKLGEEKYFLAAMRACDRDEKTKKAQGACGLHDEAEEEEDVELSADASKKKKRRRESKRKKRGQQQQEENDEKEECGVGGEEATTAPPTPPPSQGPLPVSAHTSAVESLECHCCHLSGASNEHTNPRGPAEEVKESDTEVSTTRPSLSLSLSPSHAESDSPFHSEMGSQIVGVERGVVSADLVRDPFPFSLPQSTHLAPEESSEGEKTEKRGWAELTYSVPTQEAWGAELRYSPVATQKEASSFLAWTRMPPPVPSRPFVPHGDYPLPPLETKFDADLLYGQSLKEDMSLVPECQSFLQPEMMKRDTTNEYHQIEGGKGELFSAIPPIPPPSRPAPTPCASMRDRSRARAVDGRTVVPPKVRAKAMAISGGALCR